MVQSFCTNGGWLCLVWWGLGVAMSIYSQTHAGQSEPRAYLWLPL